MEEDKHKLDMNKANPETIKKLRDSLGLNAIFPRLGCAAILKRKCGEEILLGKRNKEPEKGKWILIGGKVEPFEPLKEALKREVLEETSLKIRNIRPFDIQEIINIPNEHRVIIFCIADYESGELKASSDISEARWFSVYGLKSFIEEHNVTITVAKVLMRYRDKYLFGALR